MIGSVKEKVENSFSGLGLSLEDGMNKFGDSFEQTLDRVGDVAQSLLGGAGETVIRISENTFLEKLGKAIGNGFIKFGTFSNDKLDKLGIEVDEMIDGAAKEVGDFFTTSTDGKLDLHDILDAVNLVYDATSNTVKDYIETGEQEINTWTNSYLVE